MSRTPPAHLPFWTLALAVAGCGGSSAVRDDAPAAASVAYDQTAVLGSVVDFSDPSGEPVILPAVPPETPQVAVLDPHQLPVEPLPEPAPAPVAVDVPMPVATVSIVPPAVVAVPTPEPTVAMSEPAPAPEVMAEPAPVMPAPVPVPAPVVDPYAGVEASLAFAPIPTEPAADEPVSLPPPAFPAESATPKRSSRAAKPAKVKPPVAAPVTPAAPMEIAPLVATAAPTVAAAVAEVLPTPAPAEPAPAPAPAVVEPKPVPMPEPTAVAEFAPEPQPVPLSEPVVEVAAPAPAPVVAAEVPADAVAFQPLSTEPVGLDEPLPAPVAVKPVPRPVIQRPAAPVAEPVVEKPVEVMAAAPAPVPTPAYVAPEPTPTPAPVPETVAPVMAAAPEPQPEPPPSYTPAPVPVPEVVAPVAAAVVEAASAVAAAPAFVAAPVAETPPAPPVDTAPVSITDEALKYLDDAFNQIQSTALYRDRVDWLAARSRMLDAARHAQTPADTYDALRALLGELKEDLAVFAPPATAAAVSPRPPLPNAQQLGLRSSYFDGIATIVVPSVDGDESIGSRYATLLNEMIGTLDARDTCGWIVDLRGLDGGDIQAPLVGLGPLFGEGVSGYFAYPDGRQTPYGYWRGEARGLSGSKARSYRPVALKSTSPLIAVLVGPRTAYAGEAIALAFHRRANVTTVGNPTAGRAVAARSFNLSDGATLTVTMARLADRLGRPQIGPIKPELEVGVAKVRGPVLEGDVAASLARTALRAAGCRP
jgi:carboxyl-terminal processing protease